MFRLFKKKSKLESLNAEYQKLQKEAYKLSTSSRRESDLKQAEAEEVLKQIIVLKKPDPK